MSNSKGGRGNSLGLRLSYIDQFVQDNFRSPVVDIIHPPYPGHLVGGLQLFIGTLRLCHLYHQPLVHLGCRLICLGEMSIQLAGEQQTGDLYRRG